MSCSPSDPLTHRKPLPELDQGAFITTSPYSFTISSTSTGMVTARLWGCKDNKVLRCCNFRHNASVSSLGINDSGIPTFNNWVLRAIFHPQGTIWSSPSSPLEARASLYADPAWAAATATLPGYNTCIMEAPSWAKRNADTGGTKCRLPLARQRSCSGLKIQSIIIKKKGKTFAFPIHY